VRRQAVLPGLLQPSVLLALLRVQQRRLLQGGMLLGTFFSSEGSPYVSNI
jgi:hypothetical protein